MFAIMGGRHIAADRHTENGSIGGTYPKITNGRADLDFRRGSSRSAFVV